jgi:hypothetical protein
MGYVGGVGLAAFVLSAGVQITRLEKGHGSTHDVLAWPLILIVGGLLALVASSVRASARSE